MSFDVGVEIHISHAEMNVCVQRCKITMLKQLIQLRYFMSYMPGSFLNSTLNIMPAFSQAREWSYIVMQIYIDLQLQQDLPKWINVPLNSFAVTICITLQGSGRQGENGTWNRECAERQMDKKY